MQVSEAVDYVKTDPELTAEEKEFNVGFTKKDEQALLYTNISSQIKRALTHSDIDEVEITVYSEDGEYSRQTTVEDFDGDGIIVAFKGRVPIESLKVQANPRGSRSYAQIISPQTEVNFDD